MWNNYFNVYLYHTYKWQRILNHCDIDGISYCRILLLTNTRTFTNATTFSVENRLLGNKNSGRGFALSDADTLPQSNQASFSFIFAPFSDRSFQSARLNFSHWNNTEKNCTFSLFETSVNGNVTFAYIMTFHFHSVYTGWEIYWFLPEKLPLDLCKWLLVDDHYFLSKLVSCFISIILTRKLSWKYEIINVLKIIPG